MDVTVIQKRIDAMEKAMATGALVVRHGETSTTFRSLSEMEEILARLYRQLADAAGDKPKRRVNYVRQSRKAL